MTTVVTYSLDRIQISEARRPVVETTVLSLMESIRTVGLLHPITVQKVDDAIWLVAGRNRLEAFKRLATHNKIPAVLIEVSARIAELDENLVRGALSPIEEARALAERKQLYEEAHPETKHGAVGRGGKKSRQNGDTSERHSATVAKATGQSERTIQRKVEAGEALDNHLFDAAIGTVLDKPEEIAALAKLKKEAPEEVEKLVTRAVAGEKVSAKGALKKVKRARREEELGARIRALPDERFGVILADPPWRFEPWSRESGMDRAADNHYPTMTLEQLVALDPPAAEDAVLFLWTTVPMLRLTVEEVLRAWRFEYRSHFVWIKDRTSTGFWIRNKHELLLVAVRGDVPAPAAGTQFDSVIEAPVGKHSEKPAIFAEMIERMFPSLPKLEMFGRGVPRPGWKSWGLEAEEAA